MNDAIFNTLLNQAERDFEAELREIELVACPADPLCNGSDELDDRGQHPADLAAEMVEREIAAGVLAETTDTLAEIRAARRRLTMGTFGRCESCGQDIAIERLRAVPWARRCVSHERIHEAEFRAISNHVASSPWCPTASNDVPDESTWDPEDDHPDVSAEEEAAIHELTRRGGEGDQFTATVRSASPGRSL